MQVKKLILIALSTVFFFGMTPAFAVDSVSLSQKASFEVKSEASSSEITELKQTIELLRLDLGSMKTGMKQLQAKVLEAEMERLHSQLESLQNDIKTETEETEKGLTSDFNLATPESIQVTKMEDFLEIDLDGSEDKKEVVGEVTETTKIKIPTDTDKAEGVEAGEEVVKKLKEGETKVAGKEAVESDEIGEDEGDEAEDGEEIEKSSNIIAQANGEILFQFPRSLSQKKGEAKSAETISPKQLTASVLTASKKESSFKRKSASKNSSTFSTGNVFIFGGVLGAGIVAFVLWLLHHEKKLLVATSQKFRQFDLKSGFNLSPRAKKLFKRGKSLSRISRRKNIIR